MEILFPLTRETRTLNIALLNSEKGNENKDV